MISGLDPASTNNPALDAPGPFRNPRLYVAWQLLKLAVAALLTYAIWRSYQNPDLLLDLSSWRLC